MLAARGIIVSHETIRSWASFAIEASRLARNGRDWHTLIEFCGLVNAIILDEDGVYDPAFRTIACCSA